MAADTYADQLRDRVEDLFICGAPPSVALSHISFLLPLLVAALYLLMF